MSQLAQVAVDQLVEWGIVDFCICPGSRSTPLTLAVARHPKANSHIFHDERSATFCALGFGKSGKLAVLITTSGTAVANAMPAVVEANMASIPLLLMTADRPPELRCTNANQTIDQVKLFGDQVRFFFDIPCESNRYSVSAIQNTLSLSVSKCFGIDPGPVHLNWMFREPFDLTSDCGSISYFNKPQHGLISLTANQKTDLTQILERSTAGLIVVGELTNPLEREALKEILKESSWPMIIDASSGLSLFQTPNKILAFEDLLRSPPKEFNPDVIVQFGNGLCTKRYERWLKTLTCTVLVLNGRPISSNPGSISIHRYQVHTQTLGWITTLLRQSELITWVLEHNHRVHKAIQQNDTWSEVTVLQKSVSSIPPGGLLFIGNSMPIRDLNNYVEDKDVNVYSNRGASGIDGLPSTTLGIHLSTKQPTLLVLGDLSLMHDFGVLFTLKSMTVHQAFVIVVINNFGGGIFNMLPVSEQTDVFDTHFATVHTHTLAPVTQAMGIDTYSVDSVEALNGALKECWLESGVHIIEAIVDKDVSKNLRSTIREQMCTLNQGIFE